MMYMAAARPQKNEKAIVINWCRKASFQFGVGAHAQCLIKVQDIGSIASGHVYICRISVMYAPVIMYELRSPKLFLRSPNSFNLVVLSYGAQA